MKITCRWNFNFYCHFVIVEILIQRKSELRMPWKYKLSLCCETIHTTIIPFYPFPPCNNLTDHWENNNHVHPICYREEGLNNWQGRTTSKVPSQWTTPYIYIYVYKNKTKKIPSKTHFIYIFHFISPSNQPNLKQKQQQQQQHNNKM